MSERALAAVFETRHYATVKTGVACGKQDADLVTTCRQHVTCRACLAALGPSGHYAPPRPTLGESAIRELAELRGRVKALAGEYDGAGAIAATPERAEMHRAVAADLRGLLGGGDMPGKECTGPPT